MLTLLRLVGGVEFLGDVLGDARLLGELRIVRGDCHEPALFLGLGWHDAMFLRRGPFHTALNGA
jgi:hypothetical protein